jgi:amidophosphoribosyltransferase
MCGIVGLLVKKPSLRHQLGALMVPMLTGMTERGPDSAGLAVYTMPVSEDRRKLSLYSGEHAVDWSELLAQVRHVRMRSRRTAIRRC